MTRTSAQAWIVANQQYLVARLARIRAALERHAARGQSADQDETNCAPPVLLPDADREGMPAPPALDTLAAAFGLTAFETDVLLLCAGMELDAGMAAACASAQGNPQRAYPTFGLALAALAEPHWSALTPAAPLRYWHFVELHPVEGVTTGALRIDERILHYLTGVSFIDERLQGAQEVPVPTSVAPSQLAMVERIVALWSQPSPTLIQLSGADSAAKRAVAAFACARMGLSLHALRSADIPESAADRETLVRLWRREAVLGRAALLIDCDGVDAPRAALAFAEQSRGSVLICSDRPIRLPHLQVIRVEVQRPTASEQRELWKSALGSRLNGSAGKLVSQFDLDAGAIQTASAQSLAEADPHEPEPELIERVWSACRIAARGGLEDLAQRLEPTATWHDLVLPAAQIETLREMAAHVRCRTQVYENWGFASRGMRGLGMSALFAGASGTGKTMAAEVLARELRLDLYRIDLSQVVSKFIGETEKNLRRVFDAAEMSGAVLLFDEADALFGKRSEVKDSHDRYANIEVSYLLQRMETYRGLAILTTNMKHMLDGAFLRRLRFVVQFPTPDSAQRAEIWRRIFPADLPCEGVDVSKLARLNVAGGNIRNIALSAAFLAADSGGPLRMRHLLRAARGEYAKLDRQLTDSECRDWL